LSQKDFANIHQTEVNEMKTWTKTFLLPLIPALLVSTAALAQEWAPGKQVTIVAAAGAGGGLDMVARTMAKVFDAKKIVGQPITVENKPGGGQVTGTVEFATKEARNDHKLLIVSTPFILNHIKRDGNSPIGPDQIHPLALLQVDYGVIAVRADSKFKTLKELVDSVKSNPANVQFVGGGAPGTWDHLNTILVVRKAGVDTKAFKYNSYNNGGEALTALLGGHGEAMTSDVSSIKQYVQAGKVRVLGVSSPMRLTDDEVMKAVPTYMEQGFDVTTANWRGVFMGKDVPAAAKAYWGKKVAEMAATPEWKEELKKQGVLYEFKDAKGFYSHLKDELTSYTDIYKDLGMAK
jgi:putative tricarboxylic transport membrane protein